MGTQFDFSPLHQRFFAVREESPGMWTSTVSYSPLQMQEVHSNVMTGMYAYAIPDNIVETTPARASWDLWDVANQAWIERDYPEDWNGLMAGGES